MMKVMIPIGTQAEIASVTLLKERVKSPHGQGCTKKEHRGIYHQQKVNTVLQ